MTKIDFLRNEEKNNSEIRVRDILYDIRTEELIITKETKINE